MSDAVGRGEIEQVTPQMILSQRRAENDAQHHGHSGWMVLRD